MFDIKKIFLFIKKTFSRKDILIIILLILFFFLTRLINLEKLPIFTDEGIYIRWAKTAWHDASWRFISLTDGRQPLQTWGTIPLLKLFSTKPLFAGRLFSVLTGFWSLIGVFGLLFYLFDKKTAYIGSSIYILTPYFLFYDRMALIDSAVNSASIWILFFSILLMDNPRLDLALLWGFLSGIFLLAKSSVKLFLILSVFALVLISFKKIKKNYFRIINYLILYSIVLFFSFIIYNLQRLSPFFHFVGEKNKTFIMTFGELLKNPFSNFFHNLVLIPSYVFSEMGWIMSFFALVGLFIIFKKKRHLFYYLLIWLFFSYLGIALVAKVLFPRYLLFLGGLLIIPISFYFSSLSDKKLLVFSSIIFLISILYFDYPILFRPQNIPFPPIDRGQYIEGNPAGWGLDKIMIFARKKAKEKDVLLIAEGNFGLVGDMLESLLIPGDKIFVKAYWPLEKQNLLDDQKYLQEKNVYVVFAQRQSFPLDWPIKLIKRYDKPGGKSSIFLYELH